MNTENNTIPCRREFLADVRQKTTTLRELSIEIQRAMEHIPTLQGLTAAAGLLLDNPAAVDRSRRPR